MSDRLISAVADLDEPTALGTAREQLAAGTDALAVIEACRAGMAPAGERRGGGGGRGPGRDRPAAAVRGCAGGDGGHGPGALRAADHLLRRHEGDGGRR